MTALTILMRKTCFRVLALAFIATTFIAPTTAVAEPAATQGGAYITGIEPVNDRWEKISVFSPSMNKVVVNDVYKAPKSGAPTFYLLPGIDGGDNLDPGVYFAPGSKSWFGMTDVQGFFANKNVNVVSPLGGQFSWYTDWVGDGSKQYQTYMTQGTAAADQQGAEDQRQERGRRSVEHRRHRDRLRRAGAGSLQGRRLLQRFPGPVGSGGCPASVADACRRRRERRGHVGSARRPDLWVAHDPSKNVTKLKGVGDLRRRIRRRAG